MLQTRLKKSLIMVGWLSVITGCNQLPETNYQVNQTHQMDTYRMDLSHINDRLEYRGRPRHYDGIRSYGNDNVTIFQTEPNGRINTISINPGINR